MPFKADRLRVLGYGLAGIQGNLDQRADFLTVVRKAFHVDCANCPGKLAGYFEKLSTMSKNSIEAAEEKRVFRMTQRGGVHLSINGARSFITNANLTDSRALEILATNPAWINQFEDFPKNWPEMVEAYKNDLSAEAEAAAEAEREAAKLNEQEGEFNRFESLLLQEESTPELLKEEFSIEQLKHAARFAGISIGRSGEDSLIEKLTTFFEEKHQA